MTCTAQITADAAVPSYTRAHNYLKTSPDGTKAVMYLGEMTDGTWRVAYTDDHTTWT